MYVSDDYFQIIEANSRSVATWKLEIPSQKLYLNNYIILTYKLNNCISNITKPPRMMPDINRLKKNSVFITKLRQWQL